MVVKANRLRSRAGRMARKAGRYSVGAWPIMLVGRARFIGQPGPVR